MGLLIPGFTLSWAVAKEVNRPEHSGMATSVVNLGIFLGAGILQPLVGCVLDRGRAAGDGGAGVGPRAAAARRQRGVRRRRDVVRARAPPRARSDDGWSPRAAVHRHDRARHVARVIRREEQRDLRDLLRRAQPPQRNLRLLPARAVRLRACRSCFASTASPSCTRPVSVPPGLIALTRTPLRAVRRGEAGGREHQRRVGRTAGQVDADRDLAAHADDVDDRAAAARGHALDDDVGRMDVAEELRVHRVAPRLRRRGRPARSASRRRPS